MLNSSELIVCRTGYSSLMDLLQVGKRAILIPTPGQPEQLYLGKRLTTHPQFVVQEQGRVDVHAGVVQLNSREQLTSFSRHNGELLEYAISELTKMATIVTSPIS
jgi:hypothetical protein